VIVDGRVRRGRSTLHEARAASSRLVSNDCGISPGPGTLWARLPGGTTTAVSCALS
jgi:hypothetical protein